MDDINETIDIYECECGQPCFREINSRVPRAINAGKLPSAYDICFNIKYVGWYLQSASACLGQPDATLEALAN